MDDIFDSSWQTEEVVSVHPRRTSCGEWHLGFANPLFYGCPPLEISQCILPGLECVPSFPAVALLAFCTQVLLPGQWPITYLVQKQPGVPYSWLGYALLLFLVVFFNCLLTLEQGLQSLSEALTITKLLSSLLKKTVASNCVGVDNLGTE